MTFFQRKAGVTLAICTHNGKNKLQQTIYHILNQDVHTNISWELLVIDNASTDDTSNFITQLWPNTRSQQLRIISEEKLGAIHARQRAIQEANYAYLSYIDDDNWISPNWVEEIFNIFEQNPSVAIVSCPSTANLSYTPPSYFEGLKGWLAIGTRCSEEGIIQIRPMSFWTAGLSLRLEAFNILENTSYSICLTGRTGNQTYGGEDHELCLTLTLMGWDIYYTHQIYFIHDIPSSRLEVSYLEKLIHNGGKSKAILEIYRNEYWQKKFYNPYLSIIGYFTSLLQKALKYWIKSMLGLASNPLNPNRISYLHELGRFKSYWIHFHKISQAQKNVKILRSLNFKSN
jgi:glycosyltransferase involved in cell wall biosynthesis